MNEFAGLKAYRFRIPFRRNIVFAGQSVSHRDGILLEKDGQWAEASPLPGFSSESIEDVIVALKNKSRNQPLPASLEFGLSSLTHPIFDPIHVPLNKLLMGDEEQILADADACDQQGFSAVKLKVGRGRLESEIQLVQQVRSLLPDHIQLRLDANQAWSFDQAKQFATNIKGVDIQYIEEPLQDAQLLEELYNQTKLPFALDETLTTGSSLSNWPNAVALICKPTIIGGRKQIERLAATGKPVVFSSAFESGVGVARIMQLAAEFSPDVPAGLDTLSWLTTDLLNQSPQTQNGSIFLEQLDVNTEGLEPLLS